MADNSKLEELLEQSIQAQNRTTHAVRAFVRFLFIQLSAITLAAFIYFLASSSVNAARCAAYGEDCQPNLGGQIIAWLVWVVGVIWSSNAGRSELSKSEIAKQEISLPSKPSIRDGVWQNPSNEDVQLAKSIYPEWSDDDNRNAQLILTPGQIRAWQNHWRPNLAKWVALGKPHFNGWLRNGPF